MKQLLLRTLGGYRPVKEFDEQIVGNRKVGMLGYSWGGMVAVIVLICFACCGFLAIQVLIGTILPRQFKDAGANNTLIAICITTLPSVITAIVNPIVSFKSDRTRTRWGRRMPYLIWTVPFIALFLALIGWSRQMGGALDAWFPMMNGQSQIWLLALLSVAYQVFFMIPGAVFWYLFPDVIPSNFFGRFMSYFNLIASVTAVVVNRYFLKYADQYENYLYTAIAGFFLLSMFVMILCVKEGSYPPVTGKKFGFLDSVESYCIECYSLKFYYWFFVTMALSDVSMICRNMYNMIYAQEVIGISTETFGKIMGYYGVIGVVLSLPLGYLCDKWNPLKVFGTGLVLVVVVNIASFFYVKDERTFYLTTMLLAVVYTVQMVSTIPCFVAILPQALYGQFSSANALFRAVIMALCGLGGGIMLDIVQDYQYIYLWDFGFTLAALLTFFGLYRSWKIRGGKANYVAPIMKHEDLNKSLLGRFFLWLFSWRKVHYWEEIS